MMPVPRQYSGKLARAMPSAQVALPTMAMIDPVMKPRRRPTRAIQSAAGIADNADPST